MLGDRLKICYLILKLRSFRLARLGMHTSPSQIHHLILSNTQSVVDALYQTVSLLHTDLGEKNRAFARANWEMEHVGKMYLDVYQKLLNNSLPCL